MTPTDSALVVLCCCCGQPMPYDEYDEPCYSCMHPDMPAEVWYNTTGGDDYGWQDSTWPNEY